MIQLQKQFVSGEGGFSADPLTYTQIARNDDYAVYSRGRGKLIKDWEVFKIRKFKKGQKVFAKVYDDDTEDYAVTSAFGFSAWSYNSEESAMSKFNELVKQAVETVGVVKNKRGRTARVRPNVVFPSADKWTIKDAVMVNPDYDVVSMNVFVKAQQVAGKVKNVGFAEKVKGQRGKAATMFSVVNP